MAAAAVPAVIAPGRVRTFNELDDEARAELARWCHSILLQGWGTTSIVYKTVCHSDSDDDDDLQRLTGLEGEIVAVKVINKQNLQQFEWPSDRGRMLVKVRRELFLLKLFQHPHVVSFFRQTETPSHIFIFQEWLSDDLFRYVIKRGRLLKEEAIEFTVQLARAIEYLHALGVCHRDLKPENIMMEPRKGLPARLVLVDFGMGATLPDDQAIMSTSCGSPHYICPARAQGKVYDKTSDLWSLGVIVFVLFTGSLPFDHDKLSVILDLVTKGEYQVPEDAGPWCRVICDNLLRMQPEQRWKPTQVQSYCKFVYPAAGATDQKEHEAAMQGVESVRADAAQLLREEAIRDAAAEDVEDDGAADQMRVITVLHVQETPAPPMSAPVSPASGVSPMSPMSTLDPLSPASSSSSSCCASPISSCSSAASTPNSTSAALTLAAPLPSVFQTAMSRIGRVFRPTARHAQ